MAEIMEKRDGAISFAQQSDAVSNIGSPFLLSVPAMADIKKAVAEREPSWGSTAVDQLWLQCKADACENNGCGDATNPLIDVEKPLRFAGVEALHADRTAWQQRVLLDFTTFDKGSVLTNEEGSFFLRVLRDENCFSYSAPVTTWANAKEQIQVRTPHSAVVSAMVSASLASLKSCDMIPPHEKSEACVGQIMDVPASDLLVASPNDLETGYPLDFYRTKDYHADRGPAFLKTLEKGGLHDPDVLLNTDRRYAKHPHNEVLFAPGEAGKITAMFAMTDEADASKWTGRAAEVRDFAATYNLTLVRFFTPKDPKRRSVSSRGWWT